MKIFGRILVQLVLLIVLLPVKVLIVIYGFIMCIIYTIQSDEPISTWLGYMIEGAKEQLEKEIYWVKTGIVLSEEES